MKQMPDIDYHGTFYVLFFTRYKRNILTEEMKVMVEDLILEISSELGVFVETAEVCPNKIQMIVRCSPKTGVHTYVGKIKDRSAALIRSMYPEVKKRIPSLWTQQYHVQALGVFDENLSAEFERSLSKSQYSDIKNNTQKTDRRGTDGNE